MTNAICTAIDTMLKGKSKRSSKKGLPFFKVTRKIPLDAAFNNGTPHPQAGKDIVRGACLIGNGIHGRWFKTCTINEDGTVRNAGRGTLVSKERLNDWFLMP